MVVNSATGSNVSLESSPLICRFPMKHRRALCRVVLFPLLPTSLLTLYTRGCHGYIPEEYIHALYPYPLRIRADDAYPKCIIRKRGEGISILSDKNCEIISDPYPRYESQNTGIYKIIKLLAQAEFQ